MNNMNNKHRGRELFSKYKRFLHFLEHLYKELPYKKRLKMFGKQRSKSGYLALGIRYATLRALANYIGDNVRICEDVYIYHPENLQIGSNVSIWPLTYIECSGGVTIGNDVSIAHGCTIMSEEHNYDKKELPIKDQGLRVAPVVIEDNCWIGAKAVILSGVIIGSGSIVGAGAVVTKNIPRNSVAVGVPAKVIKVR